MANTWFVPGKRYRVLMDINLVVQLVRNEHFNPGEIVRFKAVHHSPYAGASGFDFVLESPTSEKTRRWFDLYDDEPVPRWEEFFEPLND
jgi:hypothetical protein